MMLACVTVHSVSTMLTNIPVRLTLQADGDVNKLRHEKTVTLISTDFVSKGSVDMEFFTVRSSEDIVSGR